MQRGAEYELCMKMVLGSTCGFSHLVKIMYSGG